MSLKNAEKLNKDTMLDAYDKLLSSDCPETKSKELLRLLEARYDLKFNGSKKARDILTRFARDNEYNVKQAESDRLKEEADKYEEFLLHTFWDVSNLKAIGVEEPPKGDSRFEDSHKKWLDSLDKYKPEVKRVTDSEKSNYLNIYKDYSKKIGILPTPLSGFNQNAFKEEQERKRRLKHFGSHAPVEEKLIEEEKPTI